MSEKACFKCGEIKDLNMFYKHSMMADGYLNKCKECAKKDVKGNRKEKVDYYREYDRGRGCRQDKAYRDEYRSKYPKKWAALKAVAWAIRKKILVAQPCEVCGEKKTHGHHPDYSKQLDVMWLCAEHHKAWHLENGEGLNGT